jgi:hypothetical protein
VPKRAAARNNAELCDFVCRSHGVVGTFASDAWTSALRTPPLYPDAVTLEPRVPASEVLARIDTGPGCSIKDSFADLDLHADGFEVLFTADWIWRSPKPPTAAAPSEIRWTSTDLEADVVRLEGHAGSRLVSGALLNRSATVVGVSNIVDTETTLDDIWPGLLGAVTDAFPGLPIVGYESGEALDAALHHGFAPVGPLRVWIKPD